MHAKREHARVNECRTRYRVELEPRVAIPDFRNCLRHNARKCQRADRTIQPPPVRVEAASEISARYEAIEAAVCFLECSPKHIEVRACGCGGELRSRLREGG